MSFQSTLPRGERPILNLIGGVLAGFQSTLPRGERLFYKRIKETFIWFQSTLPRGERRIFHFAFHGPSCFNPRSHEGSDVSLPQNRCSPEVFQSTLPRGERQACNGAVQKA